ncbi:MAG: carboxypeptidase-like regulatory domain-containing protein [Acidobacteriia bacterium]|nr:carboxypeptidase-like regulatory domain-containing protein [Terriglobia bacterium]
MKKVSLTLAIIGLLLAATSALGEEALLKFVVLRDYNGKPVRNAGVVMHPVNKSGKQSRGGLELKTDSEGRASFDGVPYGKLRVQVLAPGFQTFGQDYEVNQPEMEITVKLKRPQEQYSIYEDHPGDKKDEKPKNEPGKKPE